MSADENDPRGAQRHLTAAKAAIKAGEKSAREAADHLAAALRAGETQASIALAVGKSEPWVSRMLTWQKACFPTDTPFGPQSKAKRERAKSVEAPKDRSNKISEKASSEVEDSDDVWVENEAKPKSNPNQNETLRKTLLLGLSGLHTMNGASRAKAVSTVNKTRLKIGMSWDDLVIPASEFT